MSNIKNKIMKNNREDNLEDNITKQQPTFTGNDMTDDDARQEGRMDKDEDLKKGDDKDSPLAEPFTKKKITPHSLSEPDANHGHSKHSMGEDEQRDATDRDAPDTTITPQQS